MKRLALFSEISVVNFYWVVVVIDCKELDLYEKKKTKRQKAEVRRDRTTSRSSRWNHERQRVNGRHDNKTRRKENRIFHA